MRVLDIWIFIFIVNMCVGLVDEFGLFAPPGSYGESAVYSGDYGHAVNSSAYGQDVLESTLGGVNATQPSQGWLSETLSYLNVAFRFLIVMIPKFLVALLDATILFPFMLVNVFQIPWALAGILGTMYYFLMGIAIFQLATGRGTREIE